MVSLALLFIPSTRPLEICFFGLEIVEQQLAVSAQHPSDFLHGLDAGSHGLTAPLVEELAGPGWRIVFPELLKGFLQKVGTDGFEIVAEKIAQPGWRSIMARITSIPCSGRLR